MSDIIFPIGRSTTELGSLRRAIDWKGAFWVASGVPALVLFSIGGISDMVGNLAFLVWAASMLMGFVQSFTYAEIAGLFPNKSGGASVYGAAAWVRYSKFIAPLSVWCNWFAWSPVLSLGCSIAAAYILNALAPIPSANSPEVAQWIAAHGAAITGGQQAQVNTAIVALTPAIRNWTLFTHTLGPVGFSLNATFFIGAIIMLVTFAIQHRGILGTANVQKYMGLLVIIPMLIVGVVPLFNGAVHFSNYSPLAPLASYGAPQIGTWNIPNWTMVLGAMFIAAWSTYGFETAVCYTSEFRNPGTDTFKAIFYLWPAVPGAVHPCALHLPGRVGPDRHAGSEDRRWLRRCRGYGEHGRQRADHPLDHGHVDDPGADPVDHDGDGRFLAHAVPGLRRWMAAALPELCERARCADARDVD